MMSASLIGRFGSSAFRLSTTAVSMSLTGSRFSSLLARVMGVGIETADMLVHEVPLRPLDGVRCALDSDRIADMD
jgi:hypothetical protein